MSDRNWQPSTPALAHGLAVRRVPEWQDLRIRETVAEANAITALVEIDPSRRSSLVGLYADTNAMLSALKGDAYYGTKDFCTLVQSSRSEFTYDHELLKSTSIPSRYGVLFLADPVRVKVEGLQSANATLDGYLETSGGHHVDVRAVCWSLMWLPVRKDGSIASPEEEVRGENALYIFGLGLDDEGDDAWVNSTWQYVDDSVNFHRNEEMRDLALIMWSLLDQDGLIETTDREPEPHEVKRARKKRQKPPETVKVVDLRKRAAAQQAVVADAERTYQHRWVVKGHWRNQSCGPKHSLRRKIYVAPYVKGPDGKPLLTKETVYRW